MTQTPITRALTAPRPADSWELLSAAQLEKLARWSIQHNMPVLELLAPLRWELTDGYPNGTLLGMLPCGLYGALLSDGSSHT